MTKIFDINHLFTELLVCGGTEYSLSCYEYNFNDDSWTEYPSSLPNAVSYTGYDSSEDWGLGIVFIVYVSSISSYYLRTKNNVLPGFIYNKLISSVTSSDKARKGGRIF
jgi:hypothetical protein